MKLTTQSQQSLMLCTAVKLT